MTVEELNVVIKAKTAGFMQKMKQATNVTRQLSTSSKSAQKQADALRSKQEKLAESVSKAKLEQQKLINTLQKKITGTMPISEVQQLERQISTAEKKSATLAKTLDDMERKRELSFTAGDVAAVDKEMEPLVAEFEETNAKAKMLKKTLAEIKANPQASAEIQQLKDQIALASQKLKNLRGEQQRVTEEIAAQSNKSSAVVTQTAAKADKAVKRVNTSLKKFGKRIKELIKSALLFSVLTKALNTLKRGFSAIVKSDSQMSSSIANIKGNLLTAFAPIYSYILPGLRSILDVIEAATARLAYFTSAVFGKSISQSQQLAKSLYSTAQGAESTAKAAEKAAKSLLSIDEINTMTDGTVSSGSSSSSVSPAFNLPDADLQAYDEYKAKIKQKLAEIELIVAAFSLAVGSILLLSGAKPALGIALIAVGAVSLISAAATNWSAMNSQVSNTLQVLTAVIATFTLALGTVLLVTGANVPLGVALMCVGAAALATQIALNWNTMSNSVRSTLTVLTATIGGFLLAIGAVLALSGTNIPLGIGLLVIGAVSLGAAAALNWETVKNTVKTVISSITSIASAALLVLGVLLCFSGAGIPLGLGLIFAGAKGISAAAKWDSNVITNKVRDVVNGIISVVERGVNFIIDKINTISWNIPDWVPGIGGGKFGFNFKRVSIPRLATGGVLAKDDPQLIIAGDNKTQREIVTPEKVIYDQAYRAMKDAGGGGGNWTIIIQRADGTEEGRVDITAAERKNIRDGRTVISIGV